MLTTNTGLELNVEELSWDDAYPLIKGVLPSLSQVMESYDNDDLKFYKARYYFGAKIFNAGKCYLPLKNGDSVDFNSELLPDSLVKNLSYDEKREDPLGILLSKTSELYLETGSRIMSHSVVNPGYVFGIPRAIDPDDSVHMPSRSSLTWNFNSGARAIFFLNRITAKSKHEKLLKELKIKAVVPESTEEQWTVFVEIAKSLEFPWYSEVLFFSREFVQRIRKAESFQLANYLMMLHRGSYNVWHNTALIWNAVFSEIEQKKHLTHYSMYSIFTARQLFLIAANSAIGFKPAMTDSSAPYSAIKDTYGKIYGFKEDGQSDVMMEPGVLDTTKTDSIYYSINNPMLAEYTPDTFKGKSLISLLEEVFCIVKAYQDNIISEHSQVESLYKVAKTTIFSFYHGNSDDGVCKDIQDSSLLAHEDERFTSSGVFPETSAFFKGCIKITKSPS